MTATDEFLDDLRARLGSYAASECPLRDDGRHSYWTSGGAWRCDCGATEPRVVGPGV